MSAFDSWRVRVAIVVSCVLPSTAFAHHEGLPGGTTAATLNAFPANVAPGWGFGLRLSLRHFDGFGDSALLQYAAVGEDVHQHAQEGSVAIQGYTAITRDFSLSLSLPFNGYRNFREGELLEDGTTRLIVDDFSGGLGDLTLVGRWRVFEKVSHHVALLGGLELPTGTTRQTDNDGNRLGAHNQPGSGSVDFQLGGAYTFARGGLGLTIDVIGHIRTEGATNFRSGNMLQADVALSYQLGPVTLLAELSYFVSETDIEDGEPLVNSGVNSLFVSPGAVFTIREQHFVYLTASVPIVQALPGIQSTQVVGGSLGYQVGFGAEAEEHAHEPDSSVHSHPHSDDGEGHHHRAVDSEPGSPSGGERHDHPHH